MQWMQSSFSLTPWVVEFIWVFLLLFGRLALALCIWTFSGTALVDLTTDTFTSEEVSVGISLSVRVTIGPFSKENESSDESL